MAAAIEWPKPGRKVDPKTDFAVVSQSVLDREALLQAVRRRESAAPVVFVHGYNYNFQESLFRLAQLKTDSNFDGTPILFSWPSLAALPGYVADKESATYSRDALANLLTDQGIEVHRATAELSVASAAPTEDAVKMAMPASSTFLRPIASEIGPWKSDIAA